MSTRDPSLALLPDPRPLVGDQRIDDASGGEHVHIYAGTGKPTLSVPMCGAREMSLAVEAAHGPRRPGRPSRRIGVAT